MSDPTPDPRSDSTADSTSNGAPDGNEGTGTGDAGAPQVEHGEIVTPSPDDEQSDGMSRESVEQPAKVMRIGSMIKQLLDEVRQAPLDERSRDRLREIFDTSVQELGEALSDDLQAELDRLAPSFGGDSTPSDAELRVAQAQLVGWLEGLFHGIQATLFAQQMAARQQLEEMRRLPPGSEDPRGATPPGTYL